MTEPIRIELPTLYGMKTVNAYLFLKPEPVLIDCGEKSRASWEALQAALSVYNLRVKDLKKVIITHAHVDHIGMAGKIANESNAEIWVNDYSYNWAINTKEMWNQRMKMMKKHILSNVPSNGQGATFKNGLTSFMEAVLNSWASLASQKVKRFPIDGILNFGGADWQVIYAPGHSNSQTCFYQKEKKWLIGADMLLRITPTPVIDFCLNDPNKRENSLSKMLESYQKMMGLDIKTVFPGHYEPFGNHRKLIKIQVSRIEKRKEETFDLIQNGKNRFFELFDALYANRMNFPGMSMLRGYLDLLLEEQRVEAREENDFIAYYAVGGGRKAKGSR